MGPIAALEAPVRQPQDAGITADEPRLVDVKYVNAWMYAALFWMVVGPVFGLIASMKLDDPTFLPNAEWFQFGRLRITHVNGVIFGLFTNVVFGFMAYGVPKLTGVPLVWKRARWAGFWILQAGVFLGETGLLLGFLKPVEAGEYALGPALVLATGFFIVSAVVLTTIAQRRVQRLYVSLWYWAASLLWTMLTIVIGHLILPYTVSGANSAAMHGFYLHDVVGLWITPAGLGVAYYLVPVGARNRLYSHKLSLLGFWFLAFFYPLNGIHHYLFSTIPEWAQTIAIAASMTLILPVWAFSVNMWGTMSGNWKRFVADDYALKFTIFGAVWYLITCFQGPTEALRGIQEITHFSDYNVGHAHSAVFGTFSVWSMAAVYFILPRYTRYGLWSKKLAGWHFWLEVLGFAVMFGALTISGFQQGYMLREGVPWALTLPRDMWKARTVGGGMMDIGLALFVFNMVMTMVQEVRVRRAEATSGAAA
jgi:cytochrome c oxidase cbb3-type subunit 1